MDYNAPIMRFFLLSFITFSCLLSGSFAKIKVASLHPLIGDIARQVGGDDIEVVDLMLPHENPHTFSPTPQRLLRAKGAHLYLASGKGLETYLPKLAGTLGSHIKILEVGRSIPSQTIAENQRQFVCCPAHARGALDPHWWHRVENMERAARIIQKEFTSIDPQHAANYRRRANAAINRLRTLDAWIQREISRIPRSKRILTTAHAAFGYFCHAYGFRSIPLQGLAPNQSVSATYQAKAIESIRQNNIPAIFPEKRTNPKMLQQIAKETRVKIASPLTADASSSYEKMMRTNVSIIVQALR